MVLNNKSINESSTNKSFIAIDCDLKDKNLDYSDLISPAAVLNEKELCNSLDFFSMKAPKKKRSNLKKIAVDDTIKNKRKRLENYFSTVDLDGWSERNFAFSNGGNGGKESGENWHDDLHYIVLKQQERSNFINQLWLFLMLALFCILLISIAGIVYSKNSILKNNQSDQSNSYEFIQKFIDDFNHTESSRSPDPANQYNLFKHDDESNENWLQREAKYLSSIIGNKENELLKLAKKELSPLLSANKNKRSAKSLDEKRNVVELIEDPELRDFDHSNLKQVEYELLADESSMIEKIEDKFEDSFEKIAKNSGFKSLFKKVKDIF